MRHVATILASIVGLAAAAGAVPAVAVAQCENEAIREEQDPQVTVLPECMALELVSPPKKFNQRANGPSVSEDGNRVMFFSISALGDTPGLLNPLLNPYVATRDEASWATASTAPPAGMVRSPFLAQSFSPDFSRWIENPVTTYQESQFFSGTAYRGALGGAFSPISPLLVPLTGGSEAVLNETEARGASADHSHLYFRAGGTGTTYLPGDPITTTGENRNTYVAWLTDGNQPSLALLGRDADGKVWGGTCGTRLGGFGGNSTGRNNGARHQGAISPDGTQVYFTARADQPETGSCSTTNKLRILKRVETPAGPWISRLVKEPSGDCTRTVPVCDITTAKGDDLFQGASVDETKVYFTTNRQLANSDRDGSATECSPTTAVNGCDLYLYDATRPLGQRLIQVSAGEVVPGKHNEVGKEAKVFNSIAGVSSDGTRAYFVAESVLTAGKNPEGKEAELAKPNLYVWNAKAGALSFIGTLAPTGAGDAARLWGTLNGTFRNDAYPVPAVGKDPNGQEIGGDGHVLTFLSKAPLTLDDADASRTDIFRYDAGAIPPTLERISKAGSGGADNGAFDVSIPVMANNRNGTDLAEMARWVSEDGQTIAFRTGEALLPADVDGESSYYLWRNGQIYLLPGASYTVGFLDAPTLSHDGLTVAFQTESQLLPQDGDTVSDVYVVRAGGGYPNPVEEVCTPDADSGCQGPASAVPAEQLPASAGFEGKGNLKPESQCKKPRVRRRGKCVKRPARGKKTGRRGAHSRDANIKRRIDR